ncbi:MAG: hypothetical protein K5920_11940 [Bacteroidales bacterium]|nr:hypothetical protein [Bacteroidales bacterium]
MRLIHLSDTHGLHEQLPDLPEADIVAHTGDITENGTIEEAEGFMASSSMACLCSCGMI